MPQTLTGVHMAAMTRSTATAAIGPSAPDDFAAGSPRTPDDWVGGAEDDDRRHAESGSDVGGSRVVADKKAGAGNQGLDLGERRAGDDLPAGEGGKILIPGGDEYRVQSVMIAQIFGDAQKPGGTPGFFRRGGHRMNHRIGIALAPGRSRRTTALPEPRTSARPGGTWPRPYVPRCAPCGCNAESTAPRGCECCRPSAA